MNHSQPQPSTNQLRLALGRTPGHERATFVASPSAASALAALDGWPAWPGGRLALIGPEGSGKTHLARAWARRTGAAIVEGETVDIARLAGKPVLLEDADRRAADATLFHLINMADAGGSLLLTGRATPRDWPAELPDLRSRLNALMVVKLPAPDDAVLERVLRAFFRERNIRPTEDIFPYLVRRIERSIPAARAIVARIDEAADAAGRDITRAFAKEVLEVDIDSLDLFE